MTTKKRDHDVCAGQIYRVPRAGKPANHVKVVRVKNKPDGPVIHYVPVTRTGNKKPIGYGLKHLETRLTRGADGWSLPMGWEPTEEE
jgi:hypothetical protein